MSTMVRSADRVSFVDRLAFTTLEDEYGGCRP
jgi:hypothetical protein